MKKFRKKESGVGIKKESSITHIASLCKYICSFKLYSKYKYDVTSADVKALEGRLAMLVAKFRKGEKQEKQVREKEGSLSHTSL